MESPLLNELQSTMRAAKNQNQPKRAFAEFKPECERSLAMLRACVANINVKNMADDTVFEKAMTNAAALRTSLREFNSGHKLKSVRELIMNADRIYNRVQSAVDMSEMGDLDSSLVERVHSACNNDLAALSHGIKSLAVAEVKQEKDEHYSASDMMTDSDEIRNLGTWKTHLPEMTKVANKKSFIMTIPVVAILKSPVKSQAFDSAGFDYRIINGHPMFLNQTVLGVNSALVKDSDTTIEAYRNSIIKSLSRKMGRRMLFVSEKGIISKELKGFMLFWLMPSHDIDLLSKACKGHVPSEWGLPF